MDPYPRIIFFGTPVFAVYSLKKIVENGYPVISIVTAPDKPAGRGLKIKVSPVKEAAMELGIPVLQPANLKDPLFLEQITNLHPDLQIIIAFRMLPKTIWALPPLGTINLHASVLPQYRGAAPINWAIINGEKETGLTTFFLNEQIDTGNIIFNSSLTIGPEENAGEIHDRLMVSGAGLLLKTMEGVVNGTIHEMSQIGLPGGDKIFKSAPKLTKEHCRIDWNQNITDIHNKIRGLSPHPGAYTELPMPDGDKLFLKIYKSSFIFTDDPHIPGSVDTDGKTYLKVSGENGYIHILELQPAGRKPLNIVDFLNGFGKLFIGNLDEQPF